MLFSIEKFTNFTPLSNKRIVMNELAVLKNIPVNTAAVASLYPENFFLNVTILSMTTNKIYRQ